MKNSFYNKAVFKITSFCLGIIISFLAIFVYTSPTTVLAYSCPCSLWSNSTTPNTPADSDTQAVEVGTKFTSDVSGTVTGMKFYKGTGNTGTHTGHLWT